MRLAAPLRWRRSSLTGLRIRQCKQGRGGDRFFESLKESEEKKKKKFKLRKELTFLFRSVSQLQQLNNTFGELQKDNTWTDMEKQFRHDPNARTIDWAFLEENFAFPEVTKA